MKFLSSTIFALSFTVSIVSARIGVHVHSNGSNNKESKPSFHRNLRVTTVGSTLVVDDDGTGNNVRAQLERTSHVSTFQVSRGKVIQVKSSPQTQEIEIRKLGNKNNDLDDSDRAFLVAVADALEMDDTLNTVEVDTTPSQVARAARHLSEWPSDLDIDYVFDVVAEMERMENRYQHMLDHPAPANAPQVPAEGGRNLAAHGGSAPAVVVIEEQGRRRLDYTSLCTSYGNWVEATHDGWGEDRWDDDTTYYAYVSMHGAGPCSDGTYFWKNSQWQCYEPDHDPDVEYAYGDCFGRCGAGCGSGTQFTLDCLDHDSCVRFGHSLASFWCNDEFLSTTDDALLAPNCF